MPPLLDKEFRRLVAVAGNPQTPERTAYFCERFFRGVSPAGKTLLEIGAGNGIVSAYALLRGARRVVALEPEAAGSTVGSSSLVRQLTDELGRNRFTFLPSTLQQYNPVGAQFDLILLHDSINHLDESACEIAHRSNGARRTYLRLFKTIAALLTPGGQVLICDCTRHNLFGLFRLRNPILPFIDWRKHQSPRFWAGLLREVGLRTQRVDWYTFYSLRHLGQLAENPVTAFFLNSKFRLIAQQKVDHRRF